MTDHSISNNLPLQLTSFIGREREIAEVKRLLSSTRLLTLTGSGGCGKTRLSLQVAKDLLDSFPNGVWFVDLAPLSDSSLVPQAIATVFELHQISDTPIVILLQIFLRAKNLLLVLDNCEHLIAACAEFADTFLHACPHLKILATSREALGVAGETAYHVPSLAVPDPQHLPPIESLSQYDAVRLFIDRAISVQSTFSVNNHNAPAVAQICHRLDGIPLALELAAARVKVFSAEEIEARLDDRFRLLTSGSRTAMPRQQTLRATIDWSFDLLSEPERVLLSRLSVFAGGWTFDAAEFVCADDGRPRTNDETIGIRPSSIVLRRDEILDFLSHLIDKSLVLAEEQDGETRYRMLETIRQYAREKLAEAGDRDAVRDRHLQYFLKFAEEVEPKLHGSEQFEWLDRLDIEHDNLRAALEWSLGEGRVEKGLRLAAALMWFWDMRAYWSEARERVERLVIQPEAAPRTLMRANALLVKANKAGPLGAEKMNNQFLEELIAIAREHGAEGKRTLVLGLVFLSNMVFIDDTASAESMLEEGLGIARSLGDEWVLALSLYVRGWLFIGRRDHRAALNVLEESLTRFKSLGDEHWAAATSWMMSLTIFREGEFARARQELEQILPFFRQAKDLLHVWRTLNVLGEIARAEGRYDLAKGFNLEGLALARELGSNIEIAIATRNVGDIALRDGNLDSAKSLFAESLALAREFDLKPRMTFALLGFAGLAIAEKQWRRAVQLLAVVATLLELEDKRTVPPAAEAEYERYLAIARPHLDEATLNAAWEEGKAMSFEQAIEYALVQPVESFQSIESAQPHDPNALTPREIEVLRWVAAGLSNAQVAGKLVISPRTVNTHLSSIYSKLGVNSRSAATRYALEHKLT